MEEQLVKDLNAKLDLVLRLVEKIAQAAGQHQDSLSNYSSELEQIVEVSDELREIKEKTVAMLSENNKLQAKMSDSHQIINFLKKELEDTKTRSRYDILTTCGNRHLFLDKIEDILDVTFRSNYPLTFCIFDLDRFKTINDTYGHEMGDATLSLFGRYLASAVRKEDLVIRWGGEEFLVVMPYTDATTAYAVCDRLRETFAEKEVVNKRTKQKIGPVTFSGGVHQMVIGESWEAAVDLADKGLYAAKHGGRNRVCIK